MKIMINARVVIVGKTQTGGQNMSLIVQRLNEEVKKIGDQVLKEEQNLDGYIGRPIALFSLKSCSISTIYHRLTTKNNHR